jgi:hypothetical protein
MSKSFDSTCRATQTPMAGCRGAERRTHDHLRHGITSLFAAFNVADDGAVITELHRRHRAIEFRKFLAAIDKAVPAASTFTWSAGFAWTL